MQTEEFEKYIKEFDTNSSMILLNKGRDYTRNGTDRLRNFKEGKDLGISPLKHCWLLAIKQFNAIYSYVAGVGESEPIEQRLFDLSNFCKLMYCIIKEEGELTAPQSSFKELYYDGRTSDILAKARAFTKGLSESDNVE